MKIIEFPLSDICRCGTTTTELGNMAYQVEDNFFDVKNRRYQLADILNIALERFIFVHQHHSTTINKVDEHNIHAGENDFISGVDGDALYTYTKELPLLIFHADCVPIMFCDEQKHLVGIIHAGFIGTNKNAAKLCLDKVIKDENLNLKNLKVVIGPCRRIDNYQINEQEKDIIFQAKNEQYLKDNCFDMVQCNIDQLLKCGVREENIFDSKINTVNDDMFFSVTKKAKTGRLVSYIYLK